MLPILALLAPLSAQAAEPADWQGTRWAMSVESVLPLEVDLMAKTNEEFILKAIQLRTVVDCDKAETVGKNLVVTCAFTNVAIQAVPHGENPSERELKNSQIVIEDVIERMLKAKLETTFNKHGKVTRVDVTGIEGDNLREKRARERLRQFGADLAMGWTFKTPKKWTGTYSEANSPLLRAPSVPSAGTTNMIAHSGAEADGRTVIQSQGTGLAMVPNTPWEFVGNNKVVQGRATDQASGGGTNLPGAGGSVGGSRIQDGYRANGAAQAVGTTPELRPYDVTLRSVAVVDPETDMILERVWSVAGAGTPSSIGSFQGVNLWYNGHIRKLTADEQPDLGPTRLVHPPGIEVADLPAWEPMGT